MFHQLRSLLDRRRFSAFLLWAVLGLSALGLSQCRMVHDSVTGVDIRSTGVFSDRSSCERDCNDQFRRCRATAEERHRVNRRRCDELPSPARAQCKKAESRRYQDDIRACEQEKRLCKKACNYREGAGQAGR